MSSILDQTVLPTEAGINNEPRCPVAILVDTSSSMHGQKIAELNDGLQLFSSELKADPLASLRVEPLVIPFATDVGTDRTWVTADDFQPQAYQANGATSLASAIVVGLDAIEERKRQLRQQSLSYYRPWLFVITDGEPTDQKKLPEAIMRAEEAESMKKASIYAVGVQGADMTLLQRLSPARPALSLQGTKFLDLFIWLSASLKMQSSATVGQQVPLQPVSGWATTP